MKKVIHWELWKRLKFDHAYEWFIHKPESVQENKILRNFDMQTNYLIPAWSSDLVLIDKKKKEHVIEWILLFQRTTEWK